MVIDRGLLDLDTPVASYWPGFGKHGKDEITVRDVMNYCNVGEDLKDPRMARIWDAQRDILMSLQEQSKASTA